jgi:small conductance mechanosensitive channel
MQHSSAHIKSDKLMDSFVEQLGAYAPLVINAAKALAFLIFGFIASGIVSRFIKKRVLKSEIIDNTLGTFFASIVRYIILTIVIITVLQLFGIQATSLIAVLGAASLAIGLALQGTLSDIAAGVMLIIFRPYKVDQYVDIGGTSGTVKELSIISTELVTPDNVAIVIPNSKAWGSIITNYSAHDTRRLDLRFGIDYADDVDRAMAIIRDVLAQDSRAHKEPEAWIKLVNLGDSSVDIGVRVWCNASDYWELKFSTLKAVKQAFDDGGINIPYPHQVIVKRSSS